MLDTAAGDTPDQKSLDFFEDRHPPAADFRQDVLEGFRRTPKTLSPKYFYDERGSALFDAITETPEYYVTRVELELLDAIADRIAERAGPGAVVIEPGAGSSVKVRKLLDSLEDPAGYVGLDISSAHLQSALEDLAADYPGLSVGGVCADFTEGLELDGLDLPEGRRIIFFPGSTIGNFEPDQARAVLAGFRRGMRPGDAVLIGADRVKDEAVLTAAYDDGEGVTAAFNLNLVERINRELDGDLDASALRHKAVWNPEAERIEMHLEAIRPIEFTIAGEPFSLARGETIHSENSHKFTPRSFAALAESAGYRVVESWSDDQAYFALHWLEIAA